MGYANRDELKRTMKAAVTQVVLRTPSLQPLAAIPDFLMDKLMELDRVEARRLQGRQDELEA